MPQYPRRLWSRQLAGRFSFEGTSLDIALVTGSSGPDFVADVDRPLTDALVARGARVHHPVWHDEDVDWSSFDVAVVRTAWDYWGRRDEFVAWAARAGETTVVCNPPDVLRWNTHKSYLMELEDRGAPVVPTAWLGQGDRIDLAALLAQRGWSRAVVKPAVAAASDGLVRVTTDRPAVLAPVAARVGDGVALDAGWPDDGFRVYGVSRADEVDVVTGQRHLDEVLAHGDVMVQPFLSSIESDGELSVIVIDGLVSHAVRKRPAAGEYRIQEEFGGRNQVEALDADTAALATWIVEATGVDLLFARVDLLVDASGTWQLAELEATEPDLYLRDVPQAAQRLADAVLRRATSPGSTASSTPAPTPGSGSGPTA